MKLLILITISSCVFSQQLTDECLKDFRLTSLNAHNKYRAIHQVSDLTYNSTLSDIAQSHALYLARNNLFEHSENGLGENLAKSTLSFRLILNCSYWANHMTDKWYQEITLYDFNVPKAYSGAGHFTQVIWKSTSQLGVGFAFDNRILNDRNTTILYYVANYFKPGNVKNQYASNVFPILID